ncbi:hypothetical protein OFN10_27365, partial [Escherichia coli]|nr:hypothetical protein [Escherichia coli]
TKISDLQTDPFFASYVSRMNRWGQEMFCGHRRFAGTTKLSDKMCFWSTALTKNISSGAA